MLTVNFFTPDLSSNSLGRTYVLWSLARRNGWEGRVLAPQHADIWAPLANTDFAKICRVAPGLDSAEASAMYRDADLFIAIKPVPSSYLVARRLARLFRKPLIVDIDDPDLEELSFPRLLARQLLKPRKYWPDTVVRATIGAYPHFVSNPVLQRRHEGTIIPHARPIPADVARHSRRDPIVAFVGTNRPHKGVQELRQAVAKFASAGVSLVITDSAPTDAKPWERWVGATSLVEGQRIVASSDIVILPSYRERWSAGQLPAKLIDAMAAGRAIAVSDLEPLAWALGDAGKVVRPGSVEDIERVIAEFLDPSVRAEFGARARARAAKEMSEQALQARFAEVCENAVAAHQRNGVAGSRRGLE